MPRQRKTKTPPQGLIRFEPDQDGYPVLAAYRGELPDEDFDLLYVWCDWCRKFHIHGSGKKTFGSGDGGRAPHCLAKDSAYRKRPYVICEVGRFPDAWEAYRR